MFSKIGDLIRPLLPKGDIVNRPDTQDRKKGGGKEGQPEEDAAPAGDDVSFFSIDAIRALLKQENAPDMDSHLAALDLLQRHGVVSIPVRPEQSVLEAAAAAVALLRGGQSQNFSDR